LHASSLTDDNQVIYVQYLHEVFSNVLFFPDLLGAVTSCKLFGIALKHIGRDTHAIFRIRLAKYPCHCGHCAQRQLSGSRCLTAIFAAFTQRDNCAIAIVIIPKVTTCIPLCIGITLLPYRHNLGRFWVHCSGEICSWFTVVTALYIYLQLRAIVVSRDGGMSMKRR